MRFDRYLRSFALFAALGAAIFLLAPTLAFADEDPLPSWTNSTAKDAIKEFVQESVAEGPNFIAPDDRIAAFDSDGTLQPEYPDYFQILYSVERLKAAAPEHPEWETTQIYKELLAGDLETAMALNAKKVAEILLTITAKDSPEMLAKDVSAWLDTKYPNDKGEGRTYAQMVYAPMQELLAYLKANGFKIYIVTGSEAEFARAMAARLYNIPPEQVIGTQLKVKFETVDGKPQAVRQPKIDTLNVGKAKVINLQNIIGRPPALAFGNSDGDFEMLEWTTTSPGKRLGLILHHTDAEREFAYDAKASNGKLKKGLKEAKEQKWIVVDMQKAWSRVFAQQE